MISASLFAADLIIIEKGPHVYQKIHEKVAILYYYSSDMILLMSYCPISLRMLKNTIMTTVAAASSQKHLVHAANCHPLF